MTRRRLDRTAVNLSARLDRAAAIIPTIRSHLQEQRINIVALGAAVTDSERSPSGHSDPTATVAIEVQRLDHLEHEIDSVLASIESSVNLLDDKCRHALGHRAPTESETRGDPICYVAGCDDPVGSYRLKDGTNRFRMGGEDGGMCDRHRIAAGTARRGIVEHQ